MTIKAPHAVIRGKAVLWSNTPQLHGNWILVELVTTQRSYDECFKAAQPRQHPDHKQVNTHLLPKDIFSSILVIERNSQWRRGFSSLCRASKEYFVWQISSTFFHCETMKKHTRHKVSATMGNRQQQLVPDPGDYRNVRRLYWPLEWVYHLMVFSCKKIKM